MQIDHRVPLANAWQTGAQLLSFEQRRQLANDPLNLVAVDGPTNARKSDGDAATWLPPVKSYRCDYVAAQVGHLPVLVTRGKDEKLRAFVNVCRHRLHPVASGSGNRKTLQCPYHAWTYDLDGRLRAAPRGKTELGDEVNEICLRELSVDTWSEFVLVNPDPHAEPLADALGGIPELAAQNGFAPENYEYATRLEYEVDVNWKLWAENALECYHCPVAHQTSFASLYKVDEESYQLRNFDTALAQTTRLRENGDADGPPDFQFYFLWPTSGFAQGPYSATASRITPLSVDKTRFTFDIYRRPDVDESLLMEWKELQDQTFREDEQLVLAQKIGYDSGLIPNARVMESSESSVRAFQRRTMRALLAGP